MTEATMPYINTLYPFLKSRYFLPNTTPCEYTSLVRLPYKKSRSFIICFIPDVIFLKAHPVEIAKEKQVDLPFINVLLCKSAMQAMSALWLILKTPS